MTAFGYLIVFVGGTVAVTLGTYLLMHRFAGGEVDGHTKDLAGSIMLRVSALHGLILARVFAQQMIAYQQLRAESTEEASAVADVYYDAGRYGAAAQPVAEAAAEYVRRVVEVEWAHLGATGRLSPEAWESWNAADLATLDLTPASPREDALRAHMIGKIHDIGDIRDKRENVTDTTTSKLFWLAALVGVVFIAIAYYPYPPTRYNILLLAVFGAFTGLVLLFIQLFENPYVEPAQLSPVPFERLLADIRTAGAPAR